MWVTELGPPLVLLGAPVNRGQGGPGHEAAGREGARWAGDAGLGRRAEQERLVLQLVCF